MYNQNGSTSRGDGPDRLCVWCKLCSIYVLGCRIDEQWEYHGEHTSFPWNALDINVPGVSLHQFPGDVQSRPYTGLRTRLYLGARGTVVWLENVRQQLSRNHHSHITHRDARLKSCLVQGHRNRVSLRGVLACIGEQIEQDLTDPIRVHLGFNWCARSFKSERWALSRRVLLQDVPAQFDQVTPFAVQDEPVGLDERGVQQISDEHFQTTDRALYILQAQAHKVIRICTFEVAAQEMSPLF